MVLNYENGMLIYKECLYKGLDINIDKKNIISFVGAGGKTTSIYVLANELANIGKKVIVTTTTHMQMPKDNFVANTNINEMLEKLNENNYITVGRPTENNKITYFKNYNIAELINICDFILIEADGAKRLPLKAPNRNEPVILAESNMVIGVAGIDSLGKRIKDICHRAEIVANILNVNVNHIITTKDIAYLLSSEDGQMKNVYINQSKGFDREYRAIINKVDNKILLNSAKCISEDLIKKGLKSVITGFYK